ncbi:hypothetical protein JR316_0005506 [Psilocybe cubensis]|uniref:Uncharacterized protein n=2 Tax=Psilocybe cubensis TaxID=181762 RepID=A0A8H7Y256_PSICU|nr:hypothetical protein JR316_0005506 [Psilocybe cubensis]KAH9480988.1 hypothetical protein JR316_0005506 [Psilocybe cubensis]
MSQYNFFNFSSISLSQSGSEPFDFNVTDSYHERPNAINNFEGSVEDLLLPSLFHQYLMPEQGTQQVNSIPHPQGGIDDLNEGPLNLGDATLNDPSQAMAQAASLLAPYPSQHSAQLWDTDLDFSFLNDNLVATVGDVSSAPFYDTPAARPMRSSIAKAPNSMYSDFGHHVYGQSSVSRSDLVQTPVNTFETEHGTERRPHPPQRSTFPRDLFAGPSRQQTDMPRHRYPPYMVVRNQPHPLSYHGEEGLRHLGGAQNYQYNSTMPSPSFGETRNQNSTLEHKEHNEPHGSGFAPVEPTFTRNTGSSGNARRSEPQTEQGSRSLIKKRGPRSYNRGAKRGGKRAERIVRIDKHGNVVYRGMRPDLWTENICNSSGMVKSGWDGDYCWKESSDMYLSYRYISSACICLVTA